MVVKIAYFERMVAQQQAQEPPSALVTALELLNRLLSHTPRPSIAHICHQLHALARALLQLQVRRASAGLLQG
jgi:hypothetical protein